VCVLRREIPTRAPETIFTILPRGYIDQSHAAAAKRKSPVRSNRYPLRIRSTRRHTAQPRSSRPSLLRPLSYISDSIAMAATLSATAVSTHVVAAPAAIARKVQRPFSSAARPKAATRARVAVRAGLRVTAAVDVPLINIGTRGRCATKNAAPAPLHRPRRSLVKTWATDWRLCFARHLLTSTLKISPCAHSLLILPGLTPYRLTVSAWCGGRYGSPTFTSFISRTSLQFT